MAFEEGHFSEERLFYCKMPFEFQVIRASELIRLDARTHLDFEASKSVLQDLARACHKRGLGRALLDLRGLPLLPKPHFTTRELAALVLTFQEAGFSRQERLAILYSSDVFGGIRNFAFIGRMRGLNVQAFTDFERALEWLSEELEEPSECHQQQAVVSITRPKPKTKKLPVGLLTRRCQVAARHGPARTRHETL